MRINITSVALLVSFLSLTGCSLMGSSGEAIQAPKVQWKESGSIVLSRVAPPVTAEGVDASSLLGFLPVKAAPKGHWLAINRQSRTVSVMDGDLQLVTLQAEGIENLQPGNFEVIHKQKNPLWYAPDTYFTSRLLPLPEAGSKERYRKGALGDFVVYFDPQVPVHSSAVPSTEVGGIRLSAAEMSRLYYSLDIGSHVEIK